LFAGRAASNIPVAIATTLDSFSVSMVTAKKGWKLFHTIELRTAEHVISEFPGDDMPNVVTVLFKT
jgi:hypothetical protein